MSETKKEPEALFVQIPGPEVLHDPVVSHAAKLAYGRLLLYAGRDGRCNPAQETLAAEVRHLTAGTTGSRRAGGAWLDHLEAHASKLLV